MQLVAELQIGQLINVNKLVGTYTAIWKKVADILINLLHYSVILKLYRRTDVFDL